MALAGPLHACPGRPAEPPPLPHCAAPGTPKSPCSVAICRVPGTRLPHPPKKRPLPKTRSEGRASSGRPRLGSPSRRSRPGPGLQGGQGRSAGAGGSWRLPPALLPHRRGMRAALQRGSPPDRGPRPPGRDPRLEAAAAAAAGLKGLPQLNAARYLRGSTAAQAGIAQNRKRTQ